MAVSSIGGGDKPDVRTPASPVDDTTGITGAVSPSAVPADPFPDDPCKGPPPFAGQDPGDDDGAARQAASDEWELAKAACPADDPAEEGEGLRSDDVPGSGDRSDAGPPPDDLCVGPPPKAASCEDPPGD